jgi:hypothetical protein
MLTFCLSRMQPLRTYAKATGRRFDNEFCRSGGRGEPGLFFPGCGGEGWIRTSVRLRGQIYSLLPLTTRPPLHRGLPRAASSGELGAWRAGAPCGGAGRVCQRAPKKGVPGRPSLCSGGPISNLPPGGPEIGAGEGNRTLVVSLEGFCSTIELHPLAERFGPDAHAAVKRQPVAPA